jgi:hypothetical protein
MNEASYKAEICAYSSINKKRPLPVFKINYDAERNAARGIVTESPHGKVRSQRTCSE